MTSAGITFYEIYTYIDNEKMIIENNSKTNLLLNIGLIVRTNKYLKFNEFIFINICRKTTQALRMKII